ncbi:hypothetical protein V500_01062 [Pseudogymnoascus sp. VKM F-4518 (FW-2643)]|nr:hypothetical protein V500_01062 [Pseudogymnoascus sp. VKM F-4518 (FW-2643)]
MNRRRNNELYNRPTATSPQACIEETDIPALACDTSGVSSSLTRGVTPQKIEVCGQQPVPPGGNQQITARPKL